MTDYDYTRLIALCILAAAVVVQVLACRWDGRKR